MRIFFQKKNIKRTTAKITELSFCVFLFLTAPARNRMSGGKITELSFCVFLFLTAPARNRMSGGETEIHRENTHS
jgi:hypothetical protein